MQRKYIDDLGIKFKETPQGLCGDENSKRSETWQKEKELYGFDSRETWCLDYSFALWIYERLMMYKEVNCIDMKFHKFEFDKRVLTLEECIDKMIEGFKIKILYGYSGSEDDYKKINDAVKLFSITYNYLWW